jgi:hypothetical protein
MGGFLFMFVVPSIFILFLTVILVGRLQVVIWKRLLKQVETSANQMPLAELFWRASLVALIVPIVCANAGGKFPEARAKKACADCAPLIADLEKAKNLTGIYPTDASALVKSNTVLRRRYFFYYGHTGTNGVDWSPDEISKADTISLFVMTNHFQCVIPIEKMSPVTFSSYYVFSYSSDHPNWNKVLLHWSLLGAYVDEPTP